MTIRWSWNEKCGEAIIRQTLGDEVEDISVNLYEGNAFLIFIREWTENDGTGKYCLWSFLADEKHAKNCLGLDKKKDPESYNIFESGFQKIIKLRINKKKCRCWKKIITLFAQAFNNIEIEIFSEDDKDD